MYGVYGSEGGKLSHHVLTSYVRALVAIIEAQYTGKQVQGCAAGVAPVLCSIL